MRACLVAGAVLVVACSGDDGSGSGSGEDSGTAATESASGGPKFDVEPGTASNSGAESSEQGCHKVDFLFVIDSSNSMATNQAELISSFPEFVAGIQSTLVDVESYHVGVVTSDAYEFNEPGCTEYGALVTQTGGKDSGNAVCGPYAEGFRFMTEADDLDTAFACAALIGTGGDNDEAMARGATRAVADDMNAVGACNEGFIRDDALLVLVLITDEDDPGTCVSGGQSCQGSPGDPPQWFMALVDAKGGNPENVVALSLVRGAPDNVCGPPQGTELDGVRIMELVQMFGQNGLLGDICANSFGAFFDEAVGLIESACGGFTPPEG